jgi:hypothetical protein
MRKLFWVILAIALPPAVVLVHGRPVDLWTLCGALLLLLFFGFLASYMRFGLWINDMFGRFVCFSGGFNGAFRSINIRP